MIMNIDLKGIVNKNVFDVIKDFIICFICKNIVLIPVQCSNCEKLCCKVCIEKWNKIKLNCPFNCSRTSIYKEPSRIVRELLSKLIFKCPYGCSKKVNYDNLLSHKDVCALIIYEMEQEMARQYKMNLEKEEVLNSEMIFEEEIDRYYNFSRSEDDSDFIYDINSDYDLYDDFDEEVIDNEVIDDRHWEDDRLSGTALSLLDHQMQMEEMYELEMAEYNKWEIDKLQFDDSKSEIDEIETGKNYELFEQIQQENENEESYRINQFEFLKRKKCRLDDEEKFIN